VGSLPQLSAPGDAAEDGIDTNVVSRGALTLIGARLPGAADLPAPRMRAGTADLYRAIRRLAIEAGHTDPVRFWNFIPGITEPLAEDLDRYMVFNAGRYDALSEWLGSPASFTERIPTATGVGYQAKDLVCYCLSSDRPGTPAENPRQRPAYQYSKRFGPLPPCFARATLFRFDDRPTLLVGGTASVRGEETVHIGDVPGQLEETFNNLDELVVASIDDSDGPPIDDASSRFHEMRVYYVRAEDIPVIREAVAARYPNVERLELMRADICRPQLLVEIEGVARVGR